MPAFNSFERVIRLSVIEPPPLQPQTPTRAGSTHGWRLSQRTASSRSAVSGSDAPIAMVFSSFLLIPVAARLSTVNSTNSSARYNGSESRLPGHALETEGADGPP